MARRGRVDRGPRFGVRPADPRATASRSEGTVATFPSELPTPRLHGRLARSRVLPSGRSVLVALALLVGAGSAYLVARETSVFAVRTLEVTGAPPVVALQVQRALRDDLGTSLLRVDLPRARTR
ncbi:MAG: hypothetical protein ABI927_06010, partial [Gaiellaceae bacterium]